MGIPDEFGVIVLTFSFVLLLTPYLSGSDFGIFKIPDLTEKINKKLKYIGPIIFILTIFFTYSYKY